MQFVSRCCVALVTALLTMSCHSSPPEPFVFEAVGPPSSDEQRSSEHSIARLLEQLAEQSSGPPNPSPAPASQPACLCQPATMVVDTSALAGPPGPSGPPVTVEVVQAIVDRAVAQILARLPPPTPAVTTQTVSAAVDSAVAQVEARLPPPDPGKPLSWIRSYLAATATFPMNNYDLANLLGGLTTLAQSDRDFLVNNLPPGTYASADEVARAIIAHAQQASSAH